jgi:hypothetical protein
LDKLPLLARMMAPREPLPCWLADRLLLLLLLRSSAAAELLPLAWLLLLPGATSTAAQGNANELMQEPQP